MLPANLLRLRTHISTRLQCSVVQSYLHAGVKTCYTLAHICYYAALCYIFGLSAM